MHTRFDDQPKFGQAALFGGGASEEIDEADLPPVGGLPPGVGHAHAEAAQPSSHRERRFVDEDEFDDDDNLAAPSNKPITRTVQTPAALIEHLAPEESGPVGSTLEDDLDEADFFVQQSLFEEARAILEHAAHAPSESIRW